MAYYEVFNDINTYYQNKQYKKALELYLSINTADLTAHDYYTIGLCYNQLYKYDDAYKYFVKANNDNDPEAAYMLGLYYQNGKIVKLNDEEAFNYFLLSAFMGVAKGMKEVGFYYALKYKYGYRYNEALFWFNKAINTDKSLADEIIHYLKYKASENIIAEILTYRLDNLAERSKIFNILINDNSEEFNLLDDNNKKVRFKNKFFTILNLGNGYNGYSILHNLDNNDYEVFSFELRPKDEDLLLNVVEDDEIKTKVFNYYKYLKNKI